MIYELAIVANEKVGDDGIAKITDSISEVVKQKDGDVLIQDDWGVKFFAQTTSSGVKKGHFVYYIFKADPSFNLELARRFKINESILKTMFVKLGEDLDQDKLIKSYKTPFSKKYNGSVTEDFDEKDERDIAKDRKKFARKKSCWFKAKNISPNWKDPATYSWLINEFGKISPARISGISKKYQRFATTEIKRARQLGIASHMSNQILE